MPRVLHLVHESPLLGAAGGTERYVHALASATGQAVFTRDRRPEARPGLHQHEAPYPLWVLGLPNASAPVFRDTWSIPAVDAALSALIQQERVERVHVHHLAHLGLGLPGLARELGAQVLITLHDYHLRCVRGQLVNRELQRCEGPELGRCGACVAEHLRASRGLQRLAPFARALGVERSAKGLIAAPAPGRRALDQLRARDEAAQQALRAAHALIAPSRALAQRFAGMGYPKVQVLDLPLVSPLSPAPAPPPGPLRFLFVGAIIPTKGPDLLLRAFAGLGEAWQGATLRLYGPLSPFDGQAGWAQRVLQVAAQVPGARYAGTFGDEARQAVYEDADVLVLPSTWEENSPLVVREALAVGLRVVASSVGGISEIDPSMRAVEPGSESALREALLAEIKIGRKRRETKDFSMSAHVEALERLAQNL